MIPEGLHGRVNQHLAACVPTTAGALRPLQLPLRGLRCARMPDYHGKTVVKMILRTAKSSRIHAKSPPTRLIEGLLFWFESKRLDAY